MRITSKGQITIPLSIRQAAGLMPQCEVEFSIKNNQVLLHKVDGRFSRGNDIIKRMRGRGSVRMTTDQIMALTRGR
ncbi:MAG: AbrB family transcriptional regulator [Verrucomicrobia bacterium]|nr:AbrB family transcriptional regulator [Verrucomicrobiota bacterium]